MKLTRLNDIFEERKVVKSCMIWSPHLHTFWVEPIIAHRRHCQISQERLAHYSSFNGIKSLAIVRLTLWKRTFTR